MNIQQLLSSFSKTTH